MHLEASMARGRNSAVECQLPKLDVVGSNPIARFFLGGLDDDSGG